MKSALGIMVALMLILAAPVWAAEEQVVFSQTANGSRSTRPFTVKDRWEVRWDAKDDRFSVTLFSSTGEILDSLASQRKPGAGSTFYPKGGSYFLKVISGDDWNLTVVQLP